MSETLKVGDRMRVSVELLRRMCEEATPEGPGTEIIEVVDIRLDADGLKTLVLGKSRA